MSLQNIFVAIPGSGLRRIEVEHAKKGEFGYGYLYKYLSSSMFVFGIFYALIYMYLLNISKDTLEDNDDVR